MNPTATRKARNKHMVFFLYDKYSRQKVAVPDILDEYRGKTNSKAKRLIRGREMLKIIKENLYRIAIFKV